MDFAFLVVSSPRFNEFLATWGILEEVYAVALYQVEQGGPVNVETELKEPDKQRLVRKSLEEIRRLLGVVQGDAA